MRISVLALALSLVAADLPACEVALVLAMDVSRSVDAAEFDLIRHGTAHAFRHPDIVRLIGRLDGGVLVTVTQWSGAGQQRQMIPWTRLKTPAELTGFAGRIDSMRRSFRYQLTAPGEALAHAESLGRSAPINCRRRVIDLAGDGVRNTGAATAEIANRVAARGVTINGLVVRGDSPDPLEFYRQEVKRGPLAFIEIAHGYADYREAMFRKLLRELNPSLSRLR
ncbi:MAG: DUF1194 domain-containing protein [Rhodobacteraceae bacterium]|nr:DUF1194 domain-containing protein [Paracoccaceae bacterium]